MTPPPTHDLLRRIPALYHLIWLQIHPVVLQWEAVRFVPDVANKTGISTHSIEDAMQIIDFEVLYTWTDWHDPQIKQRLQRAEKAEILVPHPIPLELIRNFPSG